MAEQLFKRKKDGKFIVKKDNDEWKEVPFDTLELRLVENKLYNANDHEWQAPGIRKRALERAEQLDCDYVYAWFDSITRTPSVSFARGGPSRAVHMAPYVEVTIGLVNLNYYSVKPAENDKVK